MQTRSNFSNLRDEHQQCECNAVCANQSDADVASGTDNHTEELLSTSFGTLNEFFTSSLASCNCLAIIAEPDKSCQRSQADSTSCILFNCVCSEISYSECNYHDDCGSNQHGSVVQNPTFQGALATLIDLLGIIQVIPSIPEAGSYLLKERNFLEGDRGDLDVFHVDFLSASLGNKNIPHKSATCGDTQLLSGFSYHVTAILL